ncbi:MAG: hypothetical protein JNM21_02500 [Taibaiella sp.]|nr:hypothetical protein [Taibaiella sp.]
MNLNQTIRVLEALASGCSPTTGAVAADESILNERDVIRALQVAIEQLKNEPDKKPPEINIDAAEIQSAIALFAAQKKRASPEHLVDFFSATLSFKNESISQHELYGKYKGQYTKGSLLDFLNKWLQDHHEGAKNRKSGHKEGAVKPWEGIDFFQQAPFNRYSQKAIDQLKQKVSELPLGKSENLAAYIRKARLHYPRSHESWKAAEDELLWGALQQTNELKLLSECFQRGTHAIEERGKRLLYEQQHKQ